MSLPSAAFDTIDHNILPICLSSWFGIHGIALNWLISYLLSRRFRVKCNNSFSSLHSCLCGIPEGSVLGPLLFVMYTIQLNTQRRVDVRILMEDEWEGVYGLSIGTTFDVLERPMHINLPYLAFSEACCLQVNEYRHFVNIDILSAATVQATC